MHNREAAWLTKDTQMNLKKVQNSFFLGVRKYLYLYDMIFFPVGSFVPFVVGLSLSCQGKDIVFRFITEYSSLA
jgi:hypothetical protein